MIIKFLSESSGLPQDACVISLILLSSYLFTSIYNTLFPIWKKHVFSIVATFIVFTINFSFELYLHVFISATYTFILAKNKTNPWIIFGLNFVHLFFSQYGYVRFYSGAFMMAVVKNTMHGWDINRCHYLDYLGYIYFFPTFFVGPPFQYKHFAKSLETQILSLKVKNSKKNPLSIDSMYKYEQRKAVTKCILWAGFLFFIYLKLSVYNYADIFKPEWNEKSFVLKFFMLQVFGIVSRLKYYIAWKLSEGSAVYAGLGQVSFSDWSGIRTSNVLETEFSTTVRDYVNSWNQMTTFWLKNYINRNLRKFMGKSAAILTTFIISAAWHGIHAGYYLTFCSGAFFIQVARILRKMFNEKTRLYGPFWGILYDFVTWFLTFTCMNYTAAPFVVFDFYKGIYIWKEFYFCYHIGAVLIFIVSKIK